MAADDDAPALTDAAPDDLAADLAERLLRAHRQVASLAVPDDEKADATRRLLAITTAAKHDLARASERLDGLLADLGRAP